MLFDGSGSCVLEPAVSVAVREATVAGVKVMVHCTDPPAAMLDIGRGDWQDGAETAPAGRPVTEQLALSAPLGPLLRQV